MTVSKRGWMALASAAVAILVLGIWTASGAVAEEKKEDPSITRTRRQAEMLDTLYKTAIVLITTHYVDEKSDLAAGDAFQALFKTMKEKAYHEVRLLDATGEPYDADNSPKDDFEKAAIAALKGGAATHEQVIEKEGKRFLRVATPIPVVMKKCTLCHDNYNGVKAGQPIGALGYTIPVE
jgi:hypothetical protein